MKIRQWVEQDRWPADLYELLGRRRFDPDQQELLSAIRSTYGELLPYQNHVDPELARRAMRLQMELGRAEAILSSPEKLAACHGEIVERLRAAYAEAKLSDAERRSGDRLRAWLRDEQSVHPGQVEMITRLIRQESGRDKTSPGKPAHARRDRPPSLPPQIPGTSSPAARAAASVSAGQSLLELLASCASPASTTTAPSQAASDFSRHRAERRKIVVIWSSIAVAIFAAGMAWAGIVYSLAGRWSGKWSNWLTQADTASPRSLGSPAPSQPSTPTPNPAGPSPMGFGPLGSENPQEKPSQSDPDEDRDDQTDSARPPGNADSPATTISPPATPRRPDPVQEKWEKWGTIKSSAEDHLLEKLEMEGEFGRLNQPLDSPRTEVLLRRPTLYSETLMAVCLPGEEASRFLKGLTSGEKVRFELAVLGADNSGARAALMWIARDTARDQRVSVNPTGNPEDVPGAELLVIDTRSQTINSLAWSGDGRYLATVHGNGAATVCDARTGAVIASRSDRSARVARLAWNPDGKQIALAGSDGQIALWDFTPGSALKIVVPNEGRSDRFLSLAWSPNGTRLAAGIDGSGLVSFYDVQNGASPASRETPFGGTLAAAWSPTGKYLATAHRFGAICIWDPIRPLPVQVLPPEQADRMKAPRPAEPRAVKRPAKKAPPRAVAKPSPPVRSRRSSSIRFSYDAGPHAIAWSPDGKHLAIAAESIEIWSVFARGQAPLPRIFTPKGRSGRSRAVAWSPNGMYLAAGQAGSGVLTVWEVGTERDLLSWTSQGRDIYDVAWSPDGRRLATAHQDGKLRLWSTPSTASPPLQPAPEPAPDADAEPDPDADADPHPEPDADRDPFAER